MPKKEARARSQRWKQYEVQIKPALEKIAALKEIPVYDPIRAAARAKVKDVKKLQARLIDPATKDDASAILRNDTVAVRPPTGYYVIVGRGAAAAVNHTTLRQSITGRQRLGSLPVMHIGMRDPWLFYHQHGMGQPPYLLRLPGYHAPAALNAPVIRTGLRSDVFAASTDAELTLLRDKFETYNVEGWVAALESRATRVTLGNRTALQNFGLPRVDIDARLDSDWPLSFPPYRLLFVNTNLQLFLVYAAKVDFCNGGGAGRTTPREAWAVPGALLTAAATRPWNPSYGWVNNEQTRTVIHGLDGLTEVTTWPNDTRVCVYGSGGIGLNQIERAHDEEHTNGRTIHVDWFARDFLHEPTFNLKRNDTVLWSPTKQLWDPDFPFMDAGDADGIRTTPTVYNTGFHIVPGSPLWRWAHHAKIRQVTAPGRLQITLYLLADVGAVANLALQGAAWIEDFWERVENVDVAARRFGFSGDYQAHGANAACVAAAGGGDLYDRLILCLGQQQDIPGEPRHVTTGFVFTPIVYRNRMVGLEADGGNVRVLGAAAAMFPGNAGPAFIAMGTYRGSMAASAVPPGFIAMGANVAAANGFFTLATPNNNFNTASQDELQSVLAATLPAHAANIAAEIVQHRQWPNNGIATMQALRDLLDANWNAHLDAIEAALSLDYRTPDVWP